MDAARSVLLALLFWLGSVVLVLTAALRALVSKRQTHRGAAMWSRYIRLIARWIMGIRIEIDEPLPRGPVIVAMKHQSNLETMALPSLFNWPAVVMKQELIDVPVWGWVARRHGAIPVDRNAKASAMRTMLRAAEAAKADGREIVIFPEGTRTAPGEAPPLRPGIAGLYKLLGLPVVPIALRSGHVWPKGFVKHPGTLTMRVLPPIQPGLPRAEFEARLHAAINGPV